MKKYICLLFIFVVLAGCGNSGDDIKIQEGYDRISNDRIVFFLSYLDFESRYFCGYFVDSHGSKHYYEIQDTDIPDYSDEFVYSFLCEHSAEFQGEEFLSQEAVDRCYAYLTRVDENAEIIQETEPVYDAAGVTLIGVRVKNGVEELVPIRENSSLSWISTDEYTKKIIEVFGEDQWFVERKMYVESNSSEELQ